MVESPPANAGDTGSSPDLGRSHMPRRNWARVPQLLRSARLEPVLCSGRSHRSEKPSYSNEDPMQPKIKKLKKKKKVNGSVRNTVDRILT